MHCPVSSFLQQGWTAQFFGLPQFVQSAEHDLWPILLYCTFKATNHAKLQNQRNKRSEVLSENFEVGGCFLIKRT